jgi:dipeptidyl aminopeptidase/acylaminoacyl peptidase
MALQSGRKRAHPAYLSSLASCFAALVSRRETNRFQRLCSRQELEYLRHLEQRRHGAANIPSDQIQMDANWSPDGKSLVFGSLIFRNEPIYSIDLITKRVSPLPDSSGFFSPRWSPDGMHIAAVTTRRRLMLFDFSTQKWTEAFGSEMGWEQWSPDGRFLYFLDYGHGFHYRVVRLRLSDGKIEPIVDVQNVGRLTTGSFAAWFGLAPDGFLLFARDISIQEIYALEVDWP